MLRPTLWLAALFVVIVAAALAAAWGFGDGDPTKRIAIFGAVVASVGALKHLYDIYEKIEEKKKKADDSAEKVVAKALYDTFMIAEPTPGVELYNAGKIPVPVKRAYACFKTDKGTRCWPMHTMGEMETHYDMNNQPMARRQYLETARLEPGDPAIEFYMQFLPNGMKIKDIVDMSPDQLYIRVESNKGVVAEVMGDEILTLIKKRLGLVKN